MHDRTESTDERFNFGLISDIVEVLNKHGYQAAGIEGSPERHRALGQLTTALLTLVHAYEGTDL